LPAVKETKERGITQKELLADSLYGGDDSVEQAIHEGVKVMSPVMGKERGKTRGKSLSLAGQTVTQFKLC